MSISAITGTNKSRHILYPITYFAALDRPDQPIGNDLQAKDLVEQHPPIPDFPKFHPNLYMNMGQRYLAASELMSYMDAYWDHFREASLHRELLFRLEKRRAQLRIEEKIDFIRKDILEAYVLHLLFERVFLNSLARRQMFLDWNIQKQNRAQDWYRIITLERTERSQEPSQWFARQLSPAETFVVRRPNQIAEQDLLNLATLQSQNLTWDSVALSRHQSRSLSQFFGKEWPAAVANLQDALRRGHGLESLARIKWVAELFEKAWNQNWQHQVEFRQLVLEQLALRVSYFPEFWKLDKQVETHQLPLEKQPATIREVLSHMQLYQTIPLTNTGQNPEPVTAKPPIPYHWVDRLPQDPGLQPLLWERMQREWQVNQRDGVHQAAVRNAQFETALANPYGFVGKRLNSRSSLMEQGLQEAKRAEFVAPEHTQQLQPDFIKLQQLHIEVCKVLAGIDYAASQQAYRLSLASHQDADLRQEQSPSPIEKVRKTSQV